MIGGIYCEAYLGEFYKTDTLESVNRRTMELFGAPALPSDKTLRESITDTWYTKISRRMGRILSSWRVPGNRGYYNRTVDLTRSICLGIYYRGKLRRMYRFTGGKSEKKPWEANEWQQELKPSVISRLSNLGKTRHPDPAARSQAFLRQYQLIYKRGFSIVIAATMPYAVKLEKGMGINVLNSVINRMLQDVYKFKDGDKAIIYGYVFEGGKFDAGD